MPKKPVTCICGERIYMRNVAEIGCYMQNIAAPMVFVRYFCPRCLRLDEMRLRFDEWDENLLYEDGNAKKETFFPLRDENGKIIKRGKIDADECLKIHRELENADNLNDLLGGKDKSSQ